MHTTQYFLRVISQALLTPSKRVRNFVIDESQSYRESYKRDLLAGFFVFSTYSHTRQIHPIPKRNPRSLNYHHTYNKERSYSPTALTMPLKPAQRIEWARQVLRTTYSELMMYLSMKLDKDDNPSTVEEMTKDNDLNKNLVERMENIREDDFFALLAVRGNHERFLRGWMGLEEHRRHWELSYYEVRTDIQWQEHLDDLQAIYHEIKDAKLM